MAGISITWTASSANYDISAQGFDDWALWNSGTGSGTTVAPSQRKSGGGSTIGSMTRTVATLDGFSAAVRTASWTGGTPTASGSNTNGIFNTLNAGSTSTAGSDCSVTVPADTTTRRAVFYFDAYSSAVTLTCTLSDGSAGPTTNTSFNSGASAALSGFYTIDYSAASAGQTLTIKAVATTALAPFSDVEPQGLGVKVLSSGSAITAAAGVATTSTLVGASKAASATTAAAGVATTASLAGRSTAAAALTSAAGVATAATLTGQAITAVSLTAAAGVATTSALTGASTAKAATTAATGIATAATLVGASTAAAGITAAAGLATAGNLAGSSIAAANLTPAAGVATAATLVGSTVAPGSAAIIPAAGAATTSTLSGVSIAAANMVPAAGTATTATLASNGAPARGMELDYEAGPSDSKPRKVRFTSVKPILQAAIERRMGMDDAEPTYSQMRVDEASSALIAVWAASQGFETVAGDLHVTLAYSRRPVDLSDVPLLESLEIPRRGRGLERFGEAVVLTLESSALEQQWQAMRDAGASWDFPTFRPHITITYNGAGLDLETLEPYLGPIVLLDEEREALDTSPEIEESPAGSAVAAGLIALEGDTLTLQKVATLANQWKAARPVPANTTRQDAQILYLQAVLDYQQWQEDQRARLQRLARERDDKEAIETAIALLF